MAGEGVNLPRKEATDEVGRVRLHGVVRSVSDPKPDPSEKHADVEWGKRLWQRVVGWRGQRKPRAAEADDATMRAKYINDAAPILRGLITMRRDTSPYFYDSFTRQQWARFDAGSHRLAPAVLTLLKGVNEPMPISEVEEVIGPLCQLLDVQMKANDLHPFVIAVAGSVAVGKSTFARVLRALLAQAGRTIELVATDGFLWPTAILEERNLMRRKGFPESYDLERMLVFLAELKEGKSALRVPVYSHELYDIVPGQFQTINQPQVLLLEGLNVLQGSSRDSAAVAADYFDFSVYLDADENDVEQWYVERFSVLQRTVFQRPTSYFHHFKDLRAAEVRKTAQGIWRSINLPNLLQNIQPTRERASVILRKGLSHAVKEVLWRHSINGGQRQE